MFHLREWEDWYSERFSVIFIPPHCQDHHCVVNFLAGIIYMYDMTAQRIVNSCTDSE